jgi:lipopolysaccharide export system protein LptA
MRYLMIFNYLFFKQAVFQKKSSHKKNYFISASTISLFFITFFLSSNCLALSSDKDQPIELEADSADLNDQKGISIYNGNVILTQGSTQLHASTLTLFHNKQHKLTQIEAIGSPASFKQRPDGQKQDVKAKANKMLYDVTKETVHLYENAIFFQGKNSFRGDQIIYDTKNDIVKADSKKSSKGKTKSSGRVKVIIQSNNTQRNKN